jgi:hypothetical protein
MQHLYLNQPIVFIIDTQTDLSTATSIKIRYKKPDGEVAYLDAALVESGSQSITAILAGDLNDTLDEWEIRAWIVFDGDDNPVPGTPVRFIIESV